MGRRSRSRFKIKSAKIWILLVVVVGLAKLYEFMGVDPEASFSERINEASGQAFEVVMWLIVFALLLLLLRILFRRKKIEAE